MDFEFGCEECGIENEKLFDTILDNRSIKLCIRCAKSNNALVLEEERNKIQEKLQFRNQKQKETEKTKPAYTMNDLWERYRQKKQKDLKTNVENLKKIAIFEENKFLEDLEKEKQAEKHLLIEEINKDINNLEQNQNLTFSLELTKKPTLKSLFKKTFDRLKKKKEEHKTPEKQ